jgi:hypothetical protein
MADHALFIGWGEVIAGREQQAGQVFTESLQFYGQLQQQGTIAGFEPFFLEPHGGDLGGFILLRGERDQLAQLRTSAEFLRFIQRASFVVNRVGVVAAFTGDELTRQFGEFQQQATELVQ